MIALLLLPSYALEAMPAAPVAGPTLDGAPLDSSGWRNRPARLHDPYAGGEGNAGTELLVAAVIAEPVPTPAPIQADAPGAPVVPEMAEPPAGAIESLRAAIVSALKENPEIQIALARQDDARYGVHEAWSGYLPHLDMTVAIGGEYYQPQTGSTTELRRSEGVVTLNQNLWDFGTTTNDIARARAAFRSAQWGTRERIEGIAYDISRAYLDVLERQKLVDLADQEIGATEKILNMVSIQQDLGLTTPADVSRAKARLDNVKSKLLDRKSALQQARESYRRLTRHLPAMVTDLPGGQGAACFGADGGGVDRRS